MSQSSWTQIRSKDSPNPFLQQCKSIEEAWFGKQFVDESGEISRNASEALVGRLLPLRDMAMDKDFGSLKWNVIWELPRLVPKPVISRYNCEENMLDGDVLSNGVFDLLHCNYRTRPLTPSPAYTERGSS